MPEVPYNVHNTFCFCAFKFYLSILMSVQNNNERRTVIGLRSMSASVPWSSNEWIGFDAIIFI